jgi:hypothetical protein
MIEQGMPVVKQLEFSWNISDSYVKFNVIEPFAHKSCCFLSSFKATPPTLSEWLDFYKRTNAPPQLIKARIKFFNELKKNSAKNQLKLDALFSKYNIKNNVKQKPKKAVKKRVV